MLKVCVPMVPQRSVSYVSDAAITRIHEMCARALDAGPCAT